MDARDGTTLKHATQPPPLAPALLPSRPRAPHTHGAFPAPSIVIPFMLMLAPPLSGDILKLFSIESPPPPPPPPPRTMGLGGTKAPSKRPLMPPDAPGYSRPVDAPYRPWPYTEGDMSVEPSRRPPAICSACASAMASLAARMGSLATMELTLARRLGLGRETQ